MTKGDMVDRDLSVMRAAIAPPAAAKQRVRQALTQASSAGASPARLGGRGVWKALGLVLGGAIGGYWLGLEQAARIDHSRLSATVADPPAISDAARAPATRAHRDVPAQLEPVGSATVAPDASQPSSAPLERTSAPEGAELQARRPAAPGRRNHRRAAPFAADARTSELLLLQRAERAIRSGEGALALSLVAELDERHPRPLFGEERRATRVLAECSLQEPAARARAEAFLRAQPRSVYSDRVRKLCKLDMTGPDVSEEPARSDGSIEHAH